MTSDEHHVLVALGNLMPESRELVLARGEPGLRASHHRVIGNVPPEGITQTELADRVGMTKQGIGQFVTQLAESGHLRVEAKPGDRRVRLVHRTAKGDASVRGLSRLLDQLEETWSQRVGEARYREFRQTLEEIALS
jgi:DNA-binding MarR family transcriptional regulator